jgi:hypothetical protein
MNNYKDLYLKYKIKYLMLKKELNNQTGGFSLHSYKPAPRFNIGDKVITTTKQIGVIIDTKYVEKLDEINEYNLVYRVKINDGDILSFRENELSTYSPSVNPPSSNQYTPSTQNQYPQPPPYQPPTQTQYPKQPTQTTTHIVHHYPQPLYHYNPPPSSYNQHIYYDDDEDDLYPKRTSSRRKSSKSKRKSSKSKRKSSKSKRKSSKK